MRHLFLFLFLSSFSGVATAAPALTYSTYLQSGFAPNAIATDPTGNIYLAGSSVIKLKPGATDYAYTTKLFGPVANAIAVDRAGNAYVAGSYHTIQNASIAFVAKLDSSGTIVFFTPLGGPAEAVAQAVAVNAAGQILVSGLSYRAGFPSTPGAFSVPDTQQHPFLLELDPTGTQIVFSATGIGGSAMVLDGSGNIYVAGTTYLLDYPMTPGSYQPVLPAFIACTGFLCQIGAQGPNQYVSKIDPTGSKLLYSSAVSGTVGAANAGLAVDAGGNVYVTGFAQPGYPYTVDAPQIIPPAAIFSTATFRYGLPFLTKLDPAGQKVLFSIPYGGAGVQVDSAGNVYVGGGAGPLLGTSVTFAVNDNLPALANVPSECLPSRSGIQNAPYVSQVNASSGEVLGNQFLGGSTLTVSAVALSGTKAWVAGVTADSRVPFTAGALIPSTLTPTTSSGAYLGAVDFSSTRVAVAPQIACVLDSGDLMPAGPAARYQLLSIFGTGLGPVDGLAASDYSTTSLADVKVTVGGFAAPLLYVSSTQVNFAVPLLPAGVAVAPVEISTSAGAGSGLALPLLSANPSVMMNRPLTLAGAKDAEGFAALAVNADGSVNSPANSAQPGSVISVFVNGIASDADPASGPIQFSAIGWPVVNSRQLNPFIWEVILQAPGNINPPYSFSCPPQQAPWCLVQYSLSYTRGASGQLPVRSGSAASAGVSVNR